ncbi:MAG: hypothetical protein KC457_28155 [Myxococcales bacterium]|nr:hypothetical protein [Myxococcales bacterium]
MSTLDHFESAFRSAAKDQFRWQAPTLRKILVVSDRNRAEAEPYARALQTFLARALEGHAETPQWELLGAEDYALIGELHRAIESHEPDLICTYRQLHSSAATFEYSLGEYIHVLTQATTVPVLLTPNPAQGDRLAAHALENTDVVMAMTDHLQGSDRLVNYAAAFTETGGKLWLTHVEDELGFERIIEAIGKIPQIETDQARTLIHDKLLQQPIDYVESCQVVIEARRPKLRVKPLVVMGRQLATYRRLVRDHEVDLLVMNTKDDEQLAMHGMAYPIAVEIHDIPLLLL